MKDEWFFVVMEDGVLWMNGVRKRKQPIYANRIPLNFEGWLHVFEDGKIAIYTTTWEVVKQSRRIVKAPDIKVLDTEREHVI